MNYLLIFLLSLSSLVEFHTKPLEAEEHSVLIADKVLEVPCKGASLDEWGSYIAKKWGGYDSQGNWVYAYEDRVCPDGSPIDLVTVKERSNQYIFIQKEMIWEIRRANDWQRAIGRAFKIKALSGKQYAGILLVIDSVKDDALHIKNASIACRESGLYLRTITPDGFIR